MLKRTKLSRGLLLAFGGTAMMWGGVATAQTAAPVQELQRVEVTGSAIKRIDAETAVPVTVVRMADLKKEGITTVEQVMSSLTAVQVQQTTAFSVGCSNCGGASFANLRGIGQNKTLVLLNGRRIANNAIDGSAPDLNTIPFAAIDRIEVLRDGASALYGTDAIGGVINFITRSQVQGGSITLGADKPQHPGGRSKNGSLNFGYGDLDSQGFNIFGFLDYQSQHAIQGSQRDFNGRINGGLSGSTSPGNYYQSGSVVGNPSGPSCATGTFLIPNGDGSSCTMTTSKFVDYVPQSERYSGMLKSTFKINENHQAGLEYFYAKTDVRTQIAPVPFGALYQNPFRPDGTANPFYPGNSGASFTPAFTLNPAYTTSKVGKPIIAGGSNLQPGFVNVKWRDLPNGPRGDSNLNEEQRIVASLEGNIKGWDYSGALTYSSSVVDQRLISGYNNGNLITEGVLDGIINPYGAQTAAGAAYIGSALLPGLLVRSKGEVKGGDFHASREIGDWLGVGKQAAVALGVEYRHEKFISKANTSYASLVVASTGTDPTLDNEGSRNVQAGYVELNVPVLSNLDITAAARFDKYSDFGNTKNPKISFRYQPVQQVLLRGSYSTGFRAPSLYDLYSSASYSNTGSYDNPLTCPGGTPAAGFSKVNNCGSQFQELVGGNTTLKPEKSKNWTLGLVIEPIADTSLGIDFWWIRIRQTIGSLSQDTLFGDYTTFKQYYHTLADGSLSTDGTACPGASCGYVDLRTQNLGGTNTNGIDFSATYRLRNTGIGNFNFVGNSTWVHKYEYQDYENGPWNQNVGTWSGTGPVFRWQHSATVAWNLAQFGAGITGHYKSGYTDQTPTNTVASYTTLDVFGSWQPVTSLTLTAGVRNLTDRTPPFTNQTNNFQGGGWDSRYADPTGRTYYARATYNF